MNAVAWIAAVDHDEDLHLGRWLIAGSIVVAVHAGLVAAYMFFAPNADLAGTASPPVLIDFQPDAAAPETQDDLAPGPETAESEPEPVPEVKQEVAEEPIIEVPPTQTPDPEIIIPPKKEEVVEKKEEPAPKPPEPVKKPVEKQVKSVARPTSNPKVERRARAAVAPNPGSAGSTNAVPNYRSLISAHLQRFKRPAAGEGTAVVSFTVDRSGRVVARNLARSSGSSTLDAEALAMIARAQPMPAFPAAIAQQRLSFTQAIRFR